MLQGTPLSMQNKLGSFGTAPGGPVMPNLKPQGILRFFCPYCAYLAKMKTPARLLDATSDVVPWQYDVHA